MEAAGDDGGKWGSDVNISTTSIFSFDTSHQNAVLWYSSKVQNVLYLMGLLKLSETLYCIGQHVAPPTNRLLGM